MWSQKEVPVKDFQVIGLALLQLAAMMDSSDAPSLLYLVRVMQQNGVFGPDALAIAEDTQQSFLKV